MSAWKYIIVPLLFCSLLQAQSRIAKGAGSPQGLVDYDWYLDTIDGGLWWCEQNVWVHSSYSPADEIFACGKLTIIHKSNGYRVINTDGNVIWPACDLIRCLDTLLLMEMPQGLHFINTSNPRLSPATRYFYRCWDQNVAPDSIGGLLAYCVEPYDRRSQEECNDMHTWGMLGFNGKWLIQPIYDAPFHFENGIAEVIYYGVKRKINEQGEFVE